MQRDFGDECDSARCAPPAIPDRVQPEERVGGVLPSPERIKALRRSADEYDTLGGQLSLGADKLYMAGKARHLRDLADELERAT